MTVFVDTSAFYANAVREDANHAQARESLVRLHDAELATSNYVLLETVALIQRRHGLRAAERHGRLIQESVRMLWVDEDLHQEAWEIWRSGAPHDLSLVDCTSFALMKAHGIGRALAFDAHFVQRGFSMRERPAS